MTRSKIQKMKFFIFLLIFLLIHTTTSSGSSREGNDVLISRKKDLEKSSVLSNPAELPDNITPRPPVEIKRKSKANESSIEIASNKTTNATKPPPRQYPGEGHAAALNPAALLRGFYIFIGLSVLVMAYIVFRSFRLNKTRAQMVRKYGILAHRQDVEMRPLPLDEEDDEDTTVFDACNVLTNNAQHQNL